MADTLREPTAYFRSEDSPNIFPTPDLKYSSGGGPDLSTIPYPSSQEVSPSRLFIHEPQISWIGNAANIAYEAHRKGANGSTVSIFEGNMLGKKLFAVSIFPMRTVTLIASPTWGQLFVFSLQNADLLLSRGFALGTGFDKSRCRYEVDVVFCVSRLETALELGHLSNQRAVFDLANQEEISVEKRHVIA